MNSKGGTDSRVLAQLLSSYVGWLYPDARHEVDFHVLTKIEGGLGRLDLNSLGELRPRGVYLISGIQNTTHVPQETYQNSGHFKSLLLIYIQVLMTEPSVHSPPDGENPGVPLTLSFKSYGLLLSGHIANKENLLQAISAIFQQISAVSGIYDLRKSGKCSFHHDLP